MIRPLDRAHRGLWQSNFEPLPPELEQQLRHQLKEMGFEDGEIQEAIENLGEIKVGSGYGGAHLEDIIDLVQRVFRAGYSKCTLEIRLEGPEDGHIYIEVKELGRAYWDENSNSGEVGGLEGNAKK